MSYMSLKDLILLINAEDLIFKLYSYYDVNSFNDLSKLINTPAGTISKWKQRNSVNAIKKKCRELGIYNEIFGDTNTQCIDNNSGINALNNSGTQKQSIENKSTLNFDEDIIALLGTASTIITSSNKDSFKKHIKNWIVDNL